MKSQPRIFEAAKISDYKNIKKLTNKIDDLETEFKGILHIIVGVSDEKIDTGVLIAVVADSEEEYEKAKSM